MELLRLLDGFPDMGVIVCKGKYSPALVRGIKLAKQPPFFQGQKSNKSNDDFQSEETQLPNILLLQHC
jgi:hypothetical protein